MLYGLIAVFWILVPNLIAWLRRKDVPFATLFVTLRCLERRLQVVSILVVAGLAILLAGRPR